MQEEWRDVVGFDGYQVSNLGKIRGLDRLDCIGKVVHGKEKRTKRNNRGYVMASLRKDGAEHTKLIHRLVAEAFIPNPNNYPQVNHKDEDKENNSVDNLEWCTNLYNRHYGTGYARSVAKHDYKKITEANQKPVKQYSTSGGLIKTWSGVMAAYRATGIHESSIRQCCYGKSQTAGGFYWEYA